LATVHDRPEWISKPRVFPEVLAEPLRRRKPTVWFVADMGDLFHGAVSFEEIAALFGVMAATQRHTYTLLTKRADRMAEFYRWLGSWGPEYGIPPFCGALAQKRVKRWSKLNHADACSAKWPLPNVWPGASCEDQERFDERVLHLITIPTHEKAGKILSLEPQLGPIDATDLMLHEPQSEHDPRVSVNVLTGLVSGPCEYRPEWQVRLIIQGSEQLANGRSGRPFEMKWASSMRDQIEKALAPPDVPGTSHITAWPREAVPRICYYLKQTPGPNGKVDKRPELFGRMWRQLPWELRS
jgi:protein gp37